MNKTIWLISIILVLTGCTQQIRQYIQDENITCINICQSQPHPTGEGFTWNITGEPPANCNCQYYYSTSESNCDSVIIELTKEGYNCTCELKNTLCDCNCNGTKIGLILGEELTTKTKQTSSVNMISVICNATTNTVKVNIQNTGNTNIEPGVTACTLSDTDNRVINVVTVQLEEELSQNQIKTLNCNLSQKIEPEKTYKIKVILPGGVEVSSDCIAEGLSNNSENNFNVGNEGNVPINRSFILENNTQINDMTPPEILAVAINGTLVDNGSTLVINSSERLEVEVKTRDNSYNETEVDDTLYWTTAYGRPYNYVIELVTPNSDTKNITGSNGGNFYFAHNTLLTAYNNDERVLWANLGYDQVFFKCMPEGIYTLKINVTDYYNNSVVNTYYLNVKSEKNIYGYCYRFSQFTDYHWFIKNDLVNLGLCTGTVSNPDCGSPRYTSIYDGKVYFRITKRQELDFGQSIDEYFGIEVNATTGEFIKYEKLNNDRSDFWWEVGRIDD